MQYTKCLGDPERKHTCMSIRKRRKETERQRDRKKERKSEKKRSWDIERQMNKARRVEITPPSLSIFSLLSHNGPVSQNLLSKSKTSCNNC